MQGFWSMIYSSLPFSTSSSSFKSPSSSVIASVTSLNHHTSIDTITTITSDLSAATALRQSEPITSCRQSAEIYSPFPTQDHGRALLPKQHVPTSFFATRARSSSESSCRSCYSSPPPPPPHIFSPGIICPDSHHSFTPEEKLQKSKEVEAEAEARVERVLTVLDQNIRKEKEQTKEITDFNSSFSSLNTEISEPCCTIPHMPNNTTHLEEGSELIPMPVSVPTCSVRSSSQIRSAQLTPDTLRWVQRLRVSHGIHKGQSNNNIWEKPSGYLQGRTPVLMHLEDVNPEEIPQNPFMILESSLLSLWIIFSSTPREHSQNGQNGLLRLRKATGAFTLSSFPENQPQQQPRRVAPSAPSSPIPYSHQPPPSRSNSISSLIKDKPNSSVSAPNHVVTPPRRSSSITAASRSSELNLLPTVQGICEAMKGCVRGLLEMHARVVRVDNAEIYDKLALRVREDHQSIVEIVNTMATEGEPGVKEKYLQNLYKTTVHFVDALSEFVAFVESKFSPMTISNGGISMNRSHTDIASVVGREENSERSKPRHSLSAGPDVTKSKNRKKEEEIKGEGVGHKVIRSFRDLRRLSRASMAFLLPSGSDISSKHVTGLGIIDADDDYSSIMESAQLRDYRIDDLRSYASTSAVNISRDHGEDETLRGDDSDHESDASSVTSTKVRNRKRQMSVPTASPSPSPSIDIDRTSTHSRSSKTSKQSKGRTVKNWLAMITNEKSSFDPLHPLSPPPSPFASLDNLRRHISTDSDSTMHTATSMTPTRSVPSDSTATTPSDRESQDSRRGVKFPLLNRTPLQTLISPFSRKTSIRMSGNNNRFSVVIPEEGVHIHPPPAFAQTVKTSLFSPPPSPQLKSHKSVPAISHNEKQPLPAPLKPSRSMPYNPLSEAAQSMPSRPLPTSSGSFVQHRRSSTLSVFNPPPSLVMTPSQSTPVTRNPTPVSSPHLPPRKSFSSIRPKKESLKREEFQRAASANDLLTQDSGAKSSGGFFKKIGGGGGALRKMKSEGDLSKAKDLEREREKNSSSKNSIKGGSSSLSKRRQSLYVDDGKIVWKKRNKSMLELPKPNEAEVGSNMRQFYPLVDSLPPRKKSTHKKGTPGSGGEQLLISEHGQEVLVMEMCNGKFQVVAGTMEKLIIRLADQNLQDLEFVDTFLACHSFFVDSNDLLQALMARFHLRAQPGEEERFDRWQRAIQSKVLTVLLRWVRLRIEDFKNDSSLHKRLDTFLRSDVTLAGFTGEADEIRAAIEHQISRCRKAPKLSKVPSASSSAQVSPQNTISRRSSVQSGLLSPNSAGASAASLHETATPPRSPNFEHLLQDHSPILDYEAKDIAKYLCLADFQVMKSITTYEFMVGWWKTRKEKERRQDMGLHEAASLLDEGWIGVLSARANILTHWIEHELCTVRSKRDRRTLIRKFIDVARYCRGWNNFHTAMWIVMGLTARSVRKLDDTWAGVPQKDRDALKDLEDLYDLSSNMKNYRNAIANVCAPALPMFAMVLKDFTFIVDGNKTTTMPMPSQEAQSSTATDIKDGKDGKKKVPIQSLINFAKFRTLSSLVHTVTGYTCRDFPFANEIVNYPFIAGGNDVTFKITPFDSNSESDTKKVGTLDRVGEFIEKRLAASSVCGGRQSCKQKMAMMAQLLEGGGTFGEN